LRLQGIQTVGFVGLGAGVLALYGHKGQTFDFYEIDQTVVDIARSKFDNLRVSLANIRYFIGDARILLREAPVQSYNLLILDAFSSGAIPTHLLTLEAMEEFGRVIKKDGLLLYHISNRYIDLLPVLQCNAQKLGLQIKIYENPPDTMVLKYSSRWVAIGHNQNTFDQLTQDDPGWKVPYCKNVCWTDNFSNIWSVVNF
jgi:spermidine synthase